MEFAYEKRRAARLLDAIENGSLSIEDTRPLVEEADPALVYLLIGWLRARYNSGHSASDGVLGRVVSLCAHPDVAEQLEAGERDVIVAWFEEAYDYRDLDREEFISLVVEKIEG